MRYGSFPLTFDLQYGIPFYLQYLAHWPEYFIVAEAPGGELMGYSKFCSNAFSVCYSYYILCSIFHGKALKLWDFCTQSVLLNFRSWTICLNALLCSHGEGGGICGSWGMARSCHCPLGGPWVQATWTRCQTDGNVGRNLWEVGRIYFLYWHKYQYKSSVAII